MQTHNTYYACTYSTTTSDSAHAHNSKDHSRHKHIIHMYMDIYTNTMTRALILFTLTSCMHLAVTPHKSQLLLNLFTDTLYTCHLPQNFRVCIIIQCISVHTLKPLNMQRTHHYNIIQRTVQLGQSLSSIPTNVYIAG